jgi:hypothetical protein
MIKNTIKLLLAIVLFASCNQYEKTPSGLAYKITKGNGKEKLKHGQAIKLNIEYKLPAKDSVLSSSFEHIPVYFVLDTAHLGKYNFTELLTSVSEGDKIEFRLSIDTLKKMGMVEYNTIFHKGDFIAGKVDIVKTFPGQPEMMADYNKEVEAEKQKEIAALKSENETLKAENNTLKVESEEVVAILSDYSFESISLFFALMATVFLFSKNYQTLFFQ